MPPVRRRRSAPIKEVPLERREGEALIWTDGACSGNPGPGGWAAIVVPAGAEDADGIERSGGDPDTTNNRMEFTGVLEGLRALPDGSRVVVVTDSQLVLNSMTQWLDGWRRKGWKTASGSPVKNQDLIEALDEEIKRHEAVRWHWVRGHEAGEHKALNHRADELAVAAAQAARSAA
jgi:ribonuclease HI